MQKYSVMCQFFYTVMAMTKVTFFRICVLGFKDLISCQRRLCPVVLLVEDPMTGGVDVLRGN